jgi:hypothetical protein
MGPKEKRRLEREKNKRDNKRNEPENLIVEAIPFGYGLRNSRQIISTI